MYFSNEYLTIQESNWTDGENKGHSWEIFVNGVECFNQIYTTDNLEGPLKYRYIDMGLV